VRAVHARPMSLQVVDGNPAADHRVDPGGQAPRRRRRGALMVVVALAACAVAAALLGGVSSGPSVAGAGGRSGSGGSAAAGRSQGGPPSLLLGESAATRADIEQDEALLGHRLGAVRMYRVWGEPLITSSARWAAAGGRTLFLSIASHRADRSVIPFQQVADARPGSPLYQDMVNQAEQLRRFDRTVYLAYAHEPDADLSAGDGPAFVAAWRNWVDVLRAHGASQVRFVWTMTGYSFQPDAPRPATSYWPGTRWVDAIGVDAYNTAACVVPSGTWRSPGQVFGPTLAFAAGHSRTPVVIMEWSSVEDADAPGRKAQWIGQFGDLLTSPQGRDVVAALQWGGTGRLSAATPGCSYAADSSSSALAAFGALTAHPPAQS
jgi:hypothetical protein